VVKVSAPLFRIDPGWPFLVAGLLLIGATAVVPEAEKVHGMRTQLAHLEHIEDHNFTRMQACSRFMDDLESNDPALLRRLAASQLNLMPKGERPLILASSIGATPTDWIESSVPMPAFDPEPYPDTLLARWTLGPMRLWIIGAGALSVFVGLVLTAGTANSRKEGSVPATAG
jgi:hypothetical protein